MASSSARIPEASSAATEKPKPPMSNWAFIRLAKILPMAPTTPAASSLGTPASSAAASCARSDSLARKKWRAASGSHPIPASTPVRENGKDGTA